VKIQKVYIPFVISTIKKLDIKLGENGNMKANRKFVEGEEAVSAVIGVILMVAITVAIAATVYVYVSGMLGGGPSATATVSLVQTGNYITLQKVESESRIPWGSVLLNLVDNNGANQTDAIVEASSKNDNDGDTYLSGGDTIAIQSIATLSGNEPYTLTLIYNDDSIGTAKFTPTS
jgi:flagellin-like protein